MNKHLVTSVSLAIGLLAAESLHADDLFTEEVSWSVSPADRDADVAPYSGGHVFWNLLSSGSRKWLFEGDTGMLTEGIIDSEGDRREALLEGVLYQEGNVSVKYDVHMEFELLADFAGLVGRGGEPKLELYNNVYTNDFKTATTFSGVTSGSAPSEKSDQVDPRGWRYYRIVEGTGDGTTFSGSRIVNQGSPNDYFLLSHAPGSYKFEMQIGDAASGKNLNFGASGWMFATHSTYGIRQADINIDLSPMGGGGSSIVPVPSSAVLSLAALLGLGLYGCVRKLGEARFKRALSNP